MATRRRTLSDAYTAYNAEVRSAKTQLENAQKSIMGWVSIEVLDAMEAAIKGLRDERLNAHIKRMRSLLNDPDLMVSDEKISEFKSNYGDAITIVAPAYSIYLSHQHSLQSLAIDDSSLNAIRLDRLLAIDIKRFGDSGLKHYSKKFVEVMPPPQQAPAVDQYRQAFEIYAEARTYLRLKELIHTERVVEGDERSPDFKCNFKNRDVYVEVKSLDVVGGQQKKLESQSAAFEGNLDLEQQLKTKKVATTTRIESPYKRNSADSVSSRSINRVIEVLRENIRRAIKVEQFQRGPTLLAVVLDRLLIPGDHWALVQLGQEERNYGEPISGELWNACFGRKGDQIYTFADNRDPPWTDGVLSAPGLLIDTTDPFPGIGVIFLSEFWNTAWIYGLFDSTRRTMGGWSATMTRQLLNTLCTEFNDSKNSRAGRINKA